MKLREEIIQAAVLHAEAHIEKHRINVELYLEKGVGVAGHPDVMDSIEKELEEMARYQDQIDILNTYF